MILVCMPSTNQASRMRIPFSFTILFVGAVGNILISPGPCTTILSLPTRRTLVCVPMLVRLLLSLVICTVAPLSNPQNSSESKTKFACSSFAPFFLVSSEFDAFVEDAFAAFKIFSIHLNFSALG